jgi:hypothetical protein
MIKGINTFKSILTDQRLAKFPARKALIQKPSLRRPEEPLFESAQNH